MMHPFITGELVRQRRAGLQAEANQQRLATHAQHDAAVRGRTGRLTATLHTFTRRARTLAARFI
jgi:hypothetical protein